MELRGAIKSQYAKFNVHGRILKGELDAVTPSSTLVV